MEVKRSIDDLPNDAGKNNFLLDILRETCKQSLHHHIKFRYAGQAAPVVGAPAVAEVMDFSEVQGIYVVKVGGMLRVAEPLLHAVSTSTGARRVADAHPPPMTHSALYFCSPPLTRSFKWSIKTTQPALR